MSFKQEDFNVEVKETDDLTITHPDYDLNVNQLTTDEFMAKAFAHINGEERFGFLYTKEGNPIVYFFCAYAGINFHDHFTTTDLFFIKEYEPKCFQVIIKART